MLKQQQQQQQQNCRCFPAEKLPLSPLSILSLSSLLSSLPFSVSSFSLSHPLHFTPLNHAKCRDVMSRLPLHRTRPEQFAVEGFNHLNYFFYHVWLCVCLWLPPFPPSLDLPFGATLSGKIVSIFNTGSGLWLWCCWLEVEERRRSVCVLLSLSLF